MWIFHYYKLQSSWAYINAIQRLRSDKDIVLRIGEPLQIEPIYAWRMADGNYLSFKMHFSGSKGSGHVDIIAEQKNSKWYFYLFSVSLDKTNITSVGSFWKSGDLAIILVMLWSVVVVATGFLYIVISPMVIIKMNNYASSYYLTKPWLLLSVEHDLGILASDAVSNKPKILMNMLFWGKVSIVAGLFLTIIAALI
jgi:hypothetical protein